MSRFTQIQSDEIYIDFEMELAGNKESGILLRLTLDREEDAWCGNIRETGDGGWESPLEVIPASIARLLLGDVFPQPIPPTEVMNRRGYVLAMRLLQSDIKLAEEEDEAVACFLDIEKRRARDA